MRSMALRWGGLVAALVLVLGLGVGTAAADEEDESDEAKVLVLQAIALVVNTPEKDEAIAERIEDALAAAHPEGADLALVEEAEEALAAGDMGRTRSLLEEAIGAGPFVGGGSPQPIRETSGEPGAPAFAVGGESGTAVVLDEYDPGGRLDGGDWLLVVFSAVTAVGGALLAWRWRPADSIRALRRMPAPGEASPMTGGARTASTPTTPRATAPKAATRRRWWVNGSSTSRVVSIRGCGEIPCRLTSNACSVNSTRIRPGMITTWAL